MNDMNYFVTKSQIYKIFLISISEMKSYNFLNFSLFEEIFIMTRYIYDVYDFYDLDFMVDNNQSKKEPTTMKATTQNVCYS